MDDPQHKIVVMGTGGVGKSALTIRFVMGSFQTFYDPTIEDSYQKQIEVDDTPVLVMIIDTAGQEDYLAMQGQWIRDGDGYILCYSIADKSSFKYIDSVYTKIVQELDTEDGDPLLNLVLCGCKSDLPRNRREVTFDDGKAKADQMHAKFYETSAKLNHGIGDCFYQMVREIRTNTRLKAEQEQALQKQLDIDNNNNSGDASNVAKKEKFSFKNFCSIL